MFQRDAKEINPLVCKYSSERKKKSLDVAEVLKVISRPEASGGGWECFRNAESQALSIATESELGSEFQERPGAVGVSWLPSSAGEAWKQAGDR